MPSVAIEDVQVGELGPGDHQLRLDLPAVVIRERPGSALPQHRVPALHWALDLQDQPAIEGDAIEAGRVLAVDQHQRLHDVAGRFSYASRAAAPAGCRAASPE